MGRWWEGFRSCVLRKRNLPAFRRTPRAVSSPITSQLLGRNMMRFRGGLVCEAYRLVYHSTLGSRVLQKHLDALLERTDEVSQ